MNGFCFQPPKEYPNATVYCSFSKRKALRSIFRENTFCFYLLNVPIWKKEVTINDYIPMYNSIVKRYQRACKEIGITSFCLVCSNPRCLTDIEIENGWKRQPEPKRRLELMEDHLQKARNHLMICFQFQNENSPSGMANRLSQARNELDYFDDIKKWKRYEK